MEKSLGVLSWGNQEAIAHSHWFSKSRTCMPYREKDCRKLYVTEFFFFWKILVT